MKTASTAFSLSVSEKEKEEANLIKQAFANFLRKQGNLSDYLGIFFDHIEDLDSGVVLTSISPLVKRYEIKLKKIFDMYIYSLNEALRGHEESLGDSVLDTTRDLLLEHVRKLRGCMIDLISLMKNIEEAHFPKESFNLYSSIVNESQKIERLVRKDLIGYIDYNILGKLKLGYSIPLYIKKG